MTVGLMDMSIIYRAVLPQVRFLPTSYHHISTLLSQAMMHLRMKLEQSTVQGQTHSRWVTLSGCLRLPMHGMHQAQPGLQAKQHNLIELGILTNHFEEASHTGLHQAQLYICRQSSSTIESLAC